MGVASASTGKGERGAYTLTEERRERLEQWGGHQLEKQTRGEHQLEKWTRATRGHQLEKQATRFNDSEWTANQRGEEGVGPLDKRLLLILQLFEIVST